ncbi:hypothetical protein BO99DRAFT_407664 [Aspergillus violaceofuscus CBS 115571]|uniref:Uncharacterized protein n=1 Tax=Aspergillus violaceofuscus (strain CBS 115571) TaxID=1450538 RepID=A0A2V5GRC5_ASPV1|nr:hypothetical protein BO99DRAFT_407664 [Aspergillus violaceofuscus CBS 115571]
MEDLIISRIVATAYGITGREYIPNDNPTQKRPQRMTKVASSPLSLNQKPKHAKRPRSTDPPRWRPFSPDSPETVGNCHSIRQGLALSPKPFTKFSDPIRLQPTASHPAQIVRPVCRRVHCLYQR